MAHAANIIDFGDYVSRNQPRGLFARLAQALADHRAYVALHAELNALTERELADLDISRLSIRDIAREAIYGR
jgi:uncharacterized protein YjiS (DUF1127 family)